MVMLEDCRNNILTYMVVLQSREHASNLFFKLYEASISECNIGNPWHWNRTADKLVLSQCVIWWRFIFKISIYTDLGGSCQNKLKQFRGVAGAVVQTPLSFIDFFYLLSHWSFVEISSEHFNSQNLKARELKFWEKVHLPPQVTCHMSHVIC